MLVKCSLNMKKLDNSEIIIKGYEEYIGDVKMRKDILDKVCGDNIKEVCSEKDEVFKNNSIKGFNKIFNNNKREMLSNKKLLL